MAEAASARQHDINLAAKAKTHFLMEPPALRGLHETAAGVRDKLAVLMVE